MNVAHALRIGREIVRNLFAREPLGEDTIPPPGAPPRPSIARLLFAPERLDEAPEAGPRRQRGGLARALFVPERLEEEPPGPPRARRPSLARALFAPEPLPEDPPAAPRRRRRWLRWLVVPEVLDPPP
jgi:hypothetical protein